MGFQIKSFVSIVASMLNRVKVTTNRITDLNIGSVVRTMLEAIAAEIDELYQQMFNGLKEAIPTATYNTFNFAKLQSLPASGTIRVHITAQATVTDIPAGTVFSYVGGVTSYTSGSDVTIAAGNTAANVLVVAADAGILGNLSAGTQFTAAPTITAFVSASNAAAFTNGQDLESDAQRQQRFGQYVTTLSRGTIAAVAYGAKTATLSDVNGVVIERIKFSSVVEPYVSDNTQPVGLVDVYVHNGVGSTSSNIVTQVASVLYGYIDPNTGNKIPGYQSAGAHVVVAAATEVPLNVSGSITALDGYLLADLDTLAEAAVANYILSLDIGQSYQFTQSVFLVRNIAGVGNYVQSSPVADVFASGSQKLMPGAIAIA